MGDLRTLIWTSSGILLIFCVYLSQSEWITVCDVYMGRVYSNTFDISTSELRKCYKSLPEKRSLIDCSISCYGEARCRTVVYQSDRSCLLFDKYLEDLNFTPTTTALHRERSRVVQMRIRGYNKTNGNSLVESIRCPTLCPETANCLMGCTSELEELEPMCKNVQSDSLMLTEKTTHYVQSKEYYFKDLSDDTPSSRPITVTFNKLIDESILRVKWRSTLRSAQSPSTTASALWMITFNGSNVCELESLHHNEGAAGINHHKASGIHGICEEIAAGTVTIALSVTILTEAVVYSLVGYGTYGSRLYVDEIKTVQRSKTNSASPDANFPPMFNIKQYSSKQQWKSGVDYLGSEPFWIVNYRKTFVETVLKINLDFVIGVDGPQPSCISWYIKVNDEHCQPVELVKILLVDGVTGEHRSVEIEGYCSGIHAGDVRLSLHTDRCLNVGHTMSVDFTTGLLATNQRFIVEEFMPGTKVVAVMEPNSGNLYSLPYFNIAYYGVVGQESGTSVGIAWSMPDYNKIHSSSGLRISLSADSRVRPIGGFGCRHYIKINGEECDNPGPISGVSYIPNTSNTHRPIMVEGICESIPSGQVKLDVYSGTCKSNTVTGSCYFGHSSSVHVMISETYIEREILV